MRNVFGGLQCWVELRVEPAHTRSVVHGSWKDAVPTHLERVLQVQLSGCLHPELLPSFRSILLLSYRRTSSSHFSSPAGKILQFAPIRTRICRRSALRFPTLRGSQRRTKRRSGSRLDGAAPRTTSKHSLSVKASKCNMDLFTFFQNVVTWFCTQRSDLLMECFFRDKVVLIFHPLNHWQES